jgi:hypothetical protein
LLALTAKTVKTPKARRKARNGG